MLKMKNIIQQLSLKDVTQQLSFNLKIYTEYHAEYFKLLEFFNKGI